MDYVAVVFCDSKLRNRFDSIYHFGKGTDVPLSASTTKSDGENVGVQRKIQEIQKKYEKIRKSSRKR